MASPSPDPYPPWESSVDPAPGDLRIVQAFVNTNDLDRETDRLDSLDGLRRFLDHWSLAPPETPLTAGELRQAIDLREGLRKLLGANNGEAAQPGGLDPLARALEDLPLRCGLAVDSSFELRAVGPGWPAAAARMLTVVTRAMADGTWRRLKACRRDDCRWAFFDASKNRSGKWCAMAGCGDLMKARAYRRRLRRRAGSPGDRLG